MAAKQEISKDPEQIQKRRFQGSDFQGSRADTEKTNNLNTKQNATIHDNFVNYIVAYCIINAYDNNNSLQYCKYIAAIEMTIQIMFNVVLLHIVNM